MEKILFSLLIFLNIKLSYSANDDFFIQAESLGFDLTNENDQYFHDICLNLKIIEKDVTLEYRRKYYFFPKNPNKKIEFQRPLRNNTKDCFRVNVSINNLLGTISTILVILFLFQCSSLIIALSNGISNIFTARKQVNIGDNVKNGLCFSCSRRTLDYTDLIFKCILNSIGLTCVTSKWEK